MLDLSEAGCRVFRNNVGQAQYLDRNKKLQHVRYGLCKGSSDIIGWAPVRQLPPDPETHLVKQYAVFLAVEVKTDQGKLTKGQEAFQDAVRAAGGIALVARPQVDIVSALKARLEVRGLKLVKPGL